VRATPATARPAIDTRREVRLPAGTTHDPRFLFADVLSDAEQTALLLDRDGLVLAGAYVGYDGRDVAQDVGAELSGVTDAARRATRHLSLGEWTSIVFETEVAVVAMAPAAGDGLLVLATSRTTPLGLVRRLLDRCTDRARRWLGGRL
jgi:predicted regulator of Ras-like GTPase activity (Roadblock/LC7/MglB family)